MTNTIRCKFAKKFASDLKIQIFCPLVKKKVATCPKGLSRNTVFKTYCLKICNIDIYRRNRIKLKTPLQFLYDNKTEGKIPMGMKSHITISQYPIFVLYFDINKNFDLVNSLFGLLLVVIIYSLRT